ncbi:MAG: hypothetical protein PGN34_18035 [Methylobacterium frigidaeris]
MPTSLRDAVTASLPPGLLLPEPVDRLLGWMDDEGFAQETEHGRTIHAGLSAPGDPEPASSIVSIGPSDPDYVEAWLGPDPAARGRLASLVRTGGDGSYACLWRDDAGGTRFVHLGSGSGSTMLCTLTTDPVDFLRLLAIGYVELCWPDEFPHPPAADRDDLVPPTRLRRWIEREFGVTIPRTASEIVPRPLSMDDDGDGGDPFVIWLRAVQEARDA